ncbi:MAG TPA: aldo/keto reductase [Thermoanaerobaculia bacterium]|nr:aldo/keto reductase [Thermoanaerobaculia bacterium]
MDFTRLGRTGLKVSRICLGCMSYGTPEWRDWVLSEEASRPFIRRALELGINFFDTADMYSLGASEEVLGRALRDFAKRDQVVVATKLYFPIGDGPNDRGLSRKHIFDAIDGSLRRLGTDYVDLYQIHRWDNETPIEETLDALDDVVRAGKVRYLGASSMFAWQLAKALYIADRQGWSRFVSMQNHYNLVYREEEREMLPLCREEGLGVLPWSPLARGLLAGTRRRNDQNAQNAQNAQETAPTARAKSDTYAQKMYTAEDFDVVDQVVALAERKGVKPARIALSWLLHQPAVTAPIVGATRMEHLEDAVGALEVRLDEGERRELEEAYRPHRVLGIE